jgi:hypothetical protein
MMTESLSGKIRNRNNATKKNQQWIDFSSNNMPSEKTKIEEDLLQYLRNTLKGLDMALQLCATNPF